jgi:hypothetical protein
MNIPSDRALGRTQARAFRFIAAALDSPNTEIVVKDHHDHRITNEELFRRIGRIIDQTNMKFFRLNKRPNGDFTLEFRLYE